MRILTITQRNSMTVYDISEPGKVGDNDVEMTSPISVLPEGQYVLVPIEKDRCLPKVRDDEPIFVLRGQDLVAPLAIEYWGVQARNHHSPNMKVEEAMQDAQNFRNWQAAHPKQVKYPD